MPRWSQAAVRVATAGGVDFATFTPHPIMTTNVYFRVRALAAPPWPGSGTHRSDEGIAAIDALLSTLSPHEVGVADALLDLRTLAAARSNAAAFVRQLFAVRAALGGRHSFGFERVYDAATRSVRVEVRSASDAPWCRFALPADCARVEEVANTALAYITGEDFISADAEVRFLFADDRVGKFDRSHVARRMDAGDSA